MNLSFDFMGVPPWRCRTRGPLHGARCGGAARRVQDDLDAPVARAAVGRGVGGERVQSRVAGGREAAGRDADRAMSVRTTAEARAVDSSQLVGNCAARDRLVVGVALDDDRVVELASAAARDAAEQRHAAGLERRAAAVEEQRCR